MKHHRDGHLAEVEPKVIFGIGTTADEISTSFVERCNLTIRQENKRLERRTLAFSKKVRELDGQITLYFTSFNLCRPHMSLKHKGASGKSARRNPMMMLGVTDHVWSLRELLTFLITIYNNVIRSVPFFLKTTIQIFLTASGIQWRQ